MNDPDKDDDSTLSAGDPGRQGPVSQLARRGQDRLRRVLRKKVDQLGDLLLDQAFELLSSPQHVESLQRSLANIAGWTLRRGFDADPNAELLFEFVDWLEQRHSRQAITTIILRSSLLRDTAFLDALAHLSQAINPFDEAVSHSPWSAEAVDRFKLQAGERLLDLLVELVALECDGDPPDDGMQPKVDYFEEAPIPVRFIRLAGMTRGHHLIKRRSPSRSPGIVISLIDRLRSSRPAPSGLTKFVPGLGDETLHFLVFSTTFFLQSYLLRNLIEALPDIADELRLQLQEETLIEISAPSPRDDQH